MTFCSFVKDPALRFTLRAGGRVPAGAVRTVWDERIPPLADAVRGGAEYLEGCAACDLRADCRWCDVYGYLEHGRHGARVDHLCAVAREARAYQDAWRATHRRHFEIAGITVQVDSDLPATSDTFGAKLGLFETDGPGDDVVVVRHHFGLPERNGSDGAQQVYRKPPWAIYRRADASGHTRSWVYQGISTRADDPSLHGVAVFNADHTRGELYNDTTRERAWRKGGNCTLTLFPTDQILLARLVADRQGCFLHSGGLTIDGQGLLFVGHSEAGKSTTMLMMREALGERAQILCDDRNIVRIWPEGYHGGPPGIYVHGTWSHGDVPDVSPAGALLRAILFLEQSPTNEVVPFGDRRDVRRRLLATLIRPMVTADWWNKEIDVLERIVADVPCYAMRFDRSGAIVPQVEALTR
jgi:hypothetical protein